MELIFPIVKHMANICKTLQTIYYGMRLAWLMETLSNRQGPVLMHISVHLQFYFTKKIIGVPV